MDKELTLHPVVRVTSLIVAATAIALGDGYVLASGLLLLFALYYYLGFGYLRAAWPFIRRLRWFFVSILILYGFFGPGGSGSGLQFSWAGVGDGLIRVGALAAIAAAVSLMLQTTARDDLFRAIYFLASALPLGREIRARLALRITLTLDAVDQVRATWDAHRPTRTPGERVTLRARIGEWSGAMSQMLDFAIAQADAQAPRELTIAQVRPPPAWQWLVPLGLAVLFAVL